MESQSKNYVIALALLIGSLIIGGSIIYSSKDKYEISTSPLGVYRLDKVSGKIDYCDTSLNFDTQLWFVDCSGKHVQ